MVNNKLLFTSSTIWKSDTLTFLADRPHRTTTVVLTRLVPIQGFLMLLIQR